MKLSVCDLNSFYGPAHILFDIALEVGNGEVVALLGRNGAGKSTTFRSIVGLVEQRSGRIMFPNLGEMRGRPGGRMSGGEQQMLTIARTLMGNPSLVLLDEPSEGLSPKIVEQMVDAILTMKKEGVSIVVSEQNLHFARLISDRAYIIERGRICFGGTMNELDARPDIRDAHLSL